MWLGGNNFGAIKKKSTKTKLNEFNQEENSIFMATGLNNALKPTFEINTEKYGSDNIEVFLTAVGNPPK